MDKYDQHDSAGRLHRLWHRTASFFNHTCANNDIVFPKRYFSQQQNSDNIKHSARYLALLHFGVCSSTFEQCIFVLQHSPRWCEWKSVYAGGCVTKHEYEPLDSDCTCEYQSCGIDIQQQHSEHVQRDDDW